MYNPNSNSQMLESVASDLSFLGMVVADRDESPTWTACTVGNESIQFASLMFVSNRCVVLANGKTWKITYKGSLERLSEDVAARVVKIGLAQANRLNYDPDQDSSEEEKTRDLPRHKNDEQEEPRYYS